MPSGSLGHIPETSGGLSDWRVVGNGAKGTLVGIGRASSKAVNRGLAARRQASEDE